MNTAPPDILVRSEGVGTLVWTVLASAAVHVALAGMLIVASRSLLRPRPLPLVSYSVELVAPDRLGGNRRFQSVAKSETAAGVVTVPPPGSEASAPGPAAEAPPKPPPPARDPEPVAKPAAKQPPAPVPAKVEAVKAAPAPKPAAAPAQAKARPPTVDAKAAVQPPPRDDRQVAAPESPPRAAAADPELDKRDRAIAAAIERRAGQVGAASAGGTGRTSGGPISIGPGAGAGGVAIGLEFARYYDAMITRIKQNWVWVGTNTALEAVVQFNINPEGAIINVRTVRSSGDPSYDASVERAVRAASPLAPPPEQYRDAFVEGVEITFRPEDLRS
jgi:TonB family protein